ncbi:hypothetical protein shim_38300 [Shimia sp. SK013]|uniref:hypothetical protein n=1 Tax=Shimia sp. SK013 TaxID=1389006 RepID=UPI0006B48004|nr:hypothetical protein [Shimia sp. SK013]KPA19871.1 hypothetical protein shim_38300 [Shimia sp. SK013]
MFKRLIGGAVLFGMAATAPPVAAQGLHCAERDDVVARLSSKYSEALTAGGLQGVTTNKTTLVEVWVSEKTGTFTVIMTNPMGVSCIVAAGTDWHQETRPQSGSGKSGEVPL